MFAVEFNFARVLGSPCMNTMKTFLNIKRAMALVQHREGNNENSGVVFTLKIT
jgi:hypothetical protein